MKGAKNRIRPKKIPVFPLTCRKISGSVGRKFFLFFVNFLYADVRAKLLLGAHISKKLL